MKLFSNQDPVDRLTQRLLKDFTTSQPYETGKEEVSSLFIMQVQQSIKLQQNLTQVWEFGVFSARKWLFAFSCVAVLFFFGNLFVIGSGPTSQLGTQFVLNDVSEVEDTDYIHTTSSDDPVDDVIFRKE